MNRTVVSGIAAFALLIGAGMAMNPTTAEAGSCGGGLLAKLHAKKCGGGGLFSGLKDRGCGGGGLLSGHRDRGCGGGGGLLSGLKDRGCGGGGLFSGHKDRGCGGGGLLARLKAKRASKCGAPEPDCCAPEPAPCCDPAPAPCCDPAPAPCCDPAPAPCCGGAVAAAPAPCCDGGVVVQGASDIPLGPGETLVPGSIQAVEGGDELPAPVSSSDSPAEEAPPAPTPDASTDA